MNSVCFVLPSVNQLSPHAVLMHKGTQTHDLLTQNDGVVGKGARAERAKSAGATSGLTSHQQSR